LGLVDRFTRDDVSARVWWPFAMLLVVAFVVTFPLQGRDRDSVYEATTVDATTIITDVVEPTYAEAASGEPLAGAAEERVRATLVDDILDEEPAIDVVRVWGTDGRLLVSTDPAEEPGSGAAANDDTIEAAVNGPTSSIAFQSDVGLTGGEAPPRFDVYREIEATGGAVAHVQYDDDALMKPVGDRWMAWRIALGVGGLFTLLLAALSMREPKAWSGAGVPFYITSVPAGSAVIDADDAATLKQAGAHARRRIQEMQGRVEALELEKARLEGELQRMLSGRSMGPAATAVVPRAAAGPVVPVEPVAPEPVAQAEPEPATLDVAAERPAAAVEPVEPAPEVSPVRTAPKRTPKTPRTRKRTPAPAEPVVVVPEATPEPATSLAEDSWAASNDPVVHLPDAEQPEQDDVLSVLERLVAPVPSAEPSQDAASDMRARLARTAAAKKPGSRSDDRFEHPDQG
jgi:hypothetical protein